MSQIRILTDRVANQIAAGEVVQRPAAVAKELIENSIDAGSSSIDIFVERGGKVLIKVIDDGDGMTIKDMHSSFVKHATSKINSWDYDIFTSCIYYYEVLIL